MLTKKIKSAKLKSKNWGNINQDNSEKTIITALISRWTLFEKGSAESFSFLYIIDDCSININLFLFSSKPESSKSKVIFLLPVIDSKLPQMDLAIFKS